MSQYLRDLEAERLASADRWEAAERRKEASRRSGRLILWLGLLPFLLAALGVLYSSARMSGYLQGYAAGKAGKSIPEGLLTNP